jgi:hypothetical protein
MFCDPVQQMDEYCFRSVLQPALPRPDWGPRNNDSDSDPDKTPKVPKQPAGTPPIVRIEKLLKDGSVLDATRYTSTDEDAKPEIDRDIESTSLDAAFSFSNDIESDPPLYLLDAGFRPVSDSARKKFKNHRAKFDKNGGWVGQLYPRKSYRRSKELEYVGLGGLRYVWQVAILGGFVGAVGTLSVLGLASRMRSSFRSSVHF